MEERNIAFSTMLKSQEKADTLMSGLKTFSTDTPFGLMDSAKGAKQLLAYGTTAENIIGDLKMLGNVASGVSAPLGDIVYLYGTLRSQGRAYAMDIRQFAGRGIPIYAELAKVLKVNVDQVNELVSAGKVGFPEVEQAFKNMTSGGGMFEGLMEKQTASVTGQIEKLKDNIQFMLDSIGTSSEGAIYGAIDGASTLVENYETVGEILISLIATYGLYRTALMLNMATEALAPTALARIAQSYNALLSVMDKVKKSQIVATLTNPYLIASVAIVALSYSVYKLATATSVQEQAQESLNKVMDQASKKKDELSGKTNDLVGVVNSETKTIFDQISAYKQLQGLYPNLLKNMDIQTFKTLGATEQQKLLNTAINELDFTNQEAKLIELNTLYDKFISAQRSNTGGFEIGSVADEISKSLDFSFWDKYSKNANETFEILKQTIAGLEKEKKQRQDNLKEAELQAKPEAERNKLLQDQLQVLKDQEASILASILKTGEYKRNIDGTISPISDVEKKFNSINELLDNWNKNPFAIKNAFASADPVLNELLTKMRLLNEEKKKLTGQLGSAVVPIINKSTLEKQVKDFKELEESLSPDKLKKLRAGESILPSLVNTSPEEFNKLKKLEDNYKELGETAKKAKKDLKVYEDTDKAAKADETANKTAESAAEKRLEAEQWLANKRKELSNDQIKYELEYDQKSLDSQKDSFDKQRKQNDLNYRKELLAVKEYEAAKLKEQQEAAKKLYTSKKGSDKGFDFSKFDTSTLPIGLRKEDVDKEVESRNNVAYGSFTKSNEDLVKTLTDQYQSYADQRVEIEKKFDKDIASLRSEREKVTTKEQKDLLDRSIAKATADKGKGLMTFDFERLKETPEYVRAFEDLKNTSSETLNSLLGQLQKAKETASTVLSPDQLREYTSTIQSIMDELVDRNPYAVIIDKKKELAEAEKELIKAEDQLKRVRSDSGVITGIVQKEGQLVVTYLSEKDALLAVGKAKDKYNKSNNEVLKAQKKIYDQVSELSKSLSGLGDNIGGASGQVIGFIGNIGTFATTAMDGIEQVSQKGALAISTVEKASVILTIISTAIQLMKELDSIIPDAFDKYEKYDEKIEQINDMRDAISDYELAVLKAKQAEKSWFGSDSLQNLKDYKDQQKKIFEANQKKISEDQAIYQNQSGGGWLTKAISSMPNLVGVISSMFTKDYKEGTTAAINNLRIETRKKKSGFLGSGVGGKSQKTEDLQDWINQNKDQFGDLNTELFDKDGFINKELADTIINKYGEKLVGQTKETIEELISYKEKYDEYLDQLHEYVGSLYEPLVDNMVDSIWDWFDEGKNALDSFKDYAKDTFRDIVSDMIKTILLKDVFADYQDNIAKLYEDYSKGDLTEQELSNAIAKETAEVMDRYDKTLPALQDTVNAINGSIKDVTGIDLKGDSSSSQSSSYGTSTSMDQETGGAILGRLTGVHEELIGIGQKVGYIAQWNQPLDEKFNIDVLRAPINSLSESCQRIELMIEENRNIALQTFYVVKDIKVDTSNLSEINDKLGRIESNTKAFKGK